MHRNGQLSPVSSTTPHFSYILHHLKIITNRPLMAFDADNARENPYFAYVFTKKRPLRSSDIHSLLSLLGNSMKFSIPHQIF